MASPSESTPEEESVVTLREDTARMLHDWEIEEDVEALASYIYTRFCHLNGDWGAYGFWDGVPATAREKYLSSARLLLIEDAS